MLTKNLLNRFLNIIIIGEKVNIKGMRVKFYKVPMEDPSDVSFLKKLIDAREFDPKDIVAILGKTEGNGLVNDFSRGLATLSISAYLSEVLGMPIKEVQKRIAMEMSGGTEGVISPHISVFVREYVEIEKPSSKKLSVGIAKTRELLPEEIGTTVQVEETAKAVKEAMREALIEDPADVHWVQIKCPLLTSSRIEEARGRGREPVTTDTLKSMAYSRAASALGVALALGEVDPSKITNDVINKDFSIYSQVASTSAGVELMNVEVIVLGNSPHSVSDYVISHSVMQDALDVESIKEALRKAGLKFECCPSKEDLKKVVQVFAKAGPHPSGYIRGRRTAMLTDSMLPATRQARAVVGAVIAALVGDPMVYVSGGAEHQGPAGGGPVAVLIKI